MTKRPERDEFEAAWHYMEGNIAMLANKFDVTMQSIRNWKSLYEVDAPVYNDEKVAEKLSIFDYVRRYKDSKVSLKFPVRSFMLILYKGFR